MSESFDKYKRYIWAAILGLVIGNLLDTMVAGWILFAVVAAGALIVTDMTLPYFDKGIDAIKGAISKGKAKGEEAGGKIASKAKSSKSSDKKS